ncbi:MAG: hypothetical protein ACPF9D_10215 [Owenweeksia sp.]
MKRSFGYFFAELIIVTLGVSFSLFMNDLREQKQKQEREIEVLSVISSNLKMDSLNLWRHQYALQIFEKNAVKIREVGPDVPIDSLNLYLDCITSYSMMNIADIGFQELKSGNLQLVLSNDSVNINIMSYYTNLKGYVEEWNGIDRQFILNTMIPYVVQNFPDMVIGDQARFAVEKYPGDMVLKNNEFRNLVANYVIYKQGVYMISETHQVYLSSLRKDLRKEIKRLKND